MVYDNGEYKNSRIMRAAVIDFTQEDFVVAPCWSIKECQLKMLLSLFDLKARVRLSFYAVYVKDTKRKVGKKRRHRQVHLG